MSVDSVSVAHAEEIPILHHEIFNDDIGILVDFIFLIDGKAFSIAEGILGNEVQGGVIFIFGVLCEELSPF